MLKYSLALIALTASIQSSGAQSLGPKKAEDCLSVRGRDAKIRCLIKVGTLLEDQLKTLNERLTNLEKDTPKLDTSYSLVAKFRGQCMQWVDTGKPANFVGCNQDPDQKFEFHK